MAQPDKVNFLYNSKAVFWGTAHAASRTVGNFILQFDDICILDKTDTKADIENKHDTQKLDKNKLTHWGARGTHYYNYFLPQAVGDENYFVFCNIRNPYARMVSSWKHLNFIYGDGVKVTLSLKEFLTQMDVVKAEQPYKFNGASGFFCYVDNIEEVVKESGKRPDLFLRVENLKDDVKRLPFVDLNNSVILNSYNRYIAKNEIRQLEKDRIKKRDSHNLINNPNNIDPFLPWKEYYDQESADIVYKYLKKDFDYFGYNKDSWKNEVSDEAINSTLFQT